MSKGIICSMHLVDTHCHVHSTEFAIDFDVVRTKAVESGVLQMICVGCTATDSQDVVNFVASRPGVYGAVGIHPHEAVVGEDDFELLASLARSPKVVAIGECGLDYYYCNAPENDQKQALEFQLMLARSAKLPLIFHVRDEKTHNQATVGRAFAEFFEILDRYSGTKGVVHSFTAGVPTLLEVQKRGLHVGVNGIVTFAKDDNLLQVAKTIDITKILLETDSPFLTPVPLRGKINTPANVRLVAACLAEMRGMDLGELIEATTLNARLLFSLDSEFIK